MRTSLHQYLKLLLFGFFSLVQSVSMASHGIGGDLTYKYLYPNTYLVQFAAFRDCSGIQIGSVSLEVRDFGNNPSLNCSATVLSVPMIEIPSLKYNPRPYCLQLDMNNNCTNSNTKELFEVIVYQCTLILPRPSTDWRLGCTIANRPVIANISGSPNLYVDASINNSVGLINSSPQFRIQDAPVPFVQVNQPYTFSFNSSEVNGDSLAYEMVTSIQGCGTPITYASIPKSLFANSNKPVFVDRNGNYTVDTTYTKDYPLPSFDYLQDSVVLGQRISIYKRTSWFNKFTGEFTFTPKRFVPNTPPDRGENKYVFAVRVTEYRRINGQLVKVGFVTRNVMAIVVPDANPVPGFEIFTPPIQGAKVRNDTILELSAQACNDLFATVRFLDNDTSAGSQITVSYPENPIFAGQPESLPVDNIIWTMVGNNTANPRAEIQIVPSPELAGRVFMVPFRLQDNGCPLRAVVNRVMVIRIVNDSRILAKSQGANPDTLCSSGPAEINADIERPVTFNGDTVIYRVQWTSSPNGGLPANPNLTNYTIKGAQRVRPLVVNPTQTATYHLRLTNLLATPGTCIDTTSLNVVVLPQRQVSVSVSPDSICPGSENRVSTTIQTNGVFGQLPQQFEITYSGAGIDTTIRQLSNNGNPTPISIFPTQSGQVKVSVKSINGRYSCFDSAATTVTVRSSIKASFQASYSAFDPSGNALNGAQLHLRNLSSDASQVLGFGTRIDTVQWAMGRVFRDMSGNMLPVQYQVFSNSYTPTNIIDTLIEGEYAISLWVGSKVGQRIVCRDSAVTIVNVGVIQALNNIITTSKDGKNDYFQLSKETGEADILIYNRWGTLIKRLPNYRNDYGAEDLPSGVYFYQLEGGKDRSAKRSGWFEVVKQ